MESQNLIGMKITLYMDGGWEIFGEITSSNPDTFIIRSDNKSYMIFKSKVSAILVSEAANISAKKREDQPLPSSAGVGGAAAKSEGFPMNRESFNESGMILPANLLEGLPEEGEDFSVFFSAKGDDAVKSSGITFGVEGDDPTEKD